MLLESPRRSKGFLLVKSDVLPFGDFIILPRPYDIGINILTFELMKSIANNTLTTVMLFMVGSYFIVIPAMVLYLFLKKDDNLYPLIIAGVSLFIITDIIIKPIVGELRPCEISSLSWIQHSGCSALDKYSFPSGHATVLTGLPIFLENYRVLQILYIAWMLLSLFSKLYLGLHYLTDIIAGAIISIILSYAIHAYKTQINSFVDGLMGKIFKNGIIG